MSTITDANGRARHAAGAPASQGGKFATHSSARHTGTLDAADPASPAQFAARARAEAHLAAQLAEVAEDRAQILGIRAVAASLAEKIPDATTIVVGRHWDGEDNNLAEEVGVWFADGTSATALTYTRAASGARELTDEEQSALLLAWGDLQALPGEAPYNHFEDGDDDDRAVIGEMGEHDEVYVINIKDTLSKSLPEAPDPVDVEAAIELHTIGGQIPGARSLDLELVEDVDGSYLVATGWRDNTGEPHPFDEDDPVAEQINEALFTTTGGPDKLDGTQVPGVSGPHYNQPGKYMFWIAGR